ncbi:MAG: helix-turn-helix domain-containing protein [Chitinophagales bacterium]
MIHYTFLLRDYRSILRDFAKKFHLQVIRKKVTLPPHMGKGYLYASKVSDDISFVILNLSLKHDLVLNRIKTKEYGLTLSFNQIEISEYVKFRELDKKIVDRGPKMSSIFLSSTDHDMEFSFSRDSEIRLVVIMFSPSLVKKCIKRDIQIDLRMYTDKGLHNLNNEPITFEYRQWLEDIFNTNTDSQLSSLVLRNRILMLTEKFLASFLEKDSQEAKTGNKRVKERDRQALREVEEILSKNSLDKFPSIEQLSRTAMMSSTKLKTKFKSFYGMKLYEFYNRNRLEKAKELLQSGKYSVKEVGLDIGFSNLSNFAKAFKKEFGILPNELLRVK